MSIFSSFHVGVNGINAQANKIGVISDNISNVNTVGYKQTESTFQSLINYDPSMFDGNAGVYSPSGVVSKSRTLVGAQGLLANTTSSTDLAVSGNGLFIVSDSATTNTKLLYTRAGAFKQDLNGDLKNEAGYFLKGWRLDDNGDLPAALNTTPLSSGTALSSLSTINIAQISGTPKATDLVSISANLKASQTAIDPLLYDPADETKNMAGGAVSPQFERPFTLVDSTGKAHDFTMGYVKTGTNTWAVEIYAKNLSDLAGTPTTKQVASGNVTFNGDGSLASVSPALTGPVPITWSTSGSVPSAVTFNFGTAGLPFGTPNATVIGRTDGLSQFDSAYDMHFLDQNGNEAGKLSSISVDGEGYLSALYDNDTSKRLYKIPLAQFRDPSQLEVLTGNVFAETTNTGNPSFVSNNQVGLGKIFANSLEQSNVVLESQLTDLIIAQRAYQANDKTVTTTDNLLQNLNEMGAR